MFEVLSLALISFLASMSPGPNFAIITRYALTGSFRTSVIASIGIACSLLIQVTYCALGIALLLAKSPNIFRIFQIAGAFYIGYLGVQFLCLPTDQEKAKYTPSTHAFISGFLCNLLNPYASLVIFSIFTQFVQPHTPALKVAFYGVVISLASFAWFCILGYLITHRPFRQYFMNWQKIVIMAMGLLLICIAGLMLAKSILN